MEVENGMKSEKQYVTQRKAKPNKILSNDLHTFEVLMSTVHGRRLHSDIQKMQKC